MKQLYKNVLLWAVILVMFTAFYQFFDSHSVQPKDLSYGDFLTLVDQGRVRELRIRGQVYSGTIKASGAGFLVTGEIPSEALLDRLHDHGVDVVIEREGRVEAWWLMILQGLSLMLLVTLLVVVSRNHASGAPPVVAPFRAHTLPARLNELRLSDVGGLGPARDELVQLLRDWHDVPNAAKLGGRIPKSVLLTGPTGSGKTTVARALAGDLGLPLKSMAGSEFFETFVGVGALRIREFFGLAAGERCVLFLDEIDAVARGRTQKSERDETLNQLLVELDKLEDAFFIAATDRPDLLDPGLVRPGRLDRRIELSLPDEAGRLEILELKTRAMPLARGVELGPLANATAGFSGAALERLASEAAVLAAQRGAETIEQADFQRARERVAKAVAPVSARD